MAAWLQNGGVGRGGYIPQCFAGRRVDPSRHALLWREKLVANEGGAWLLRAREGTAAIGRAGAMGGA